MVGLRREKAHKLGVRDLNDCKQRTRKCYPGQGLQSACSASWLMWDFGQCVEVAGKSARRWRSHVEHRDKP